MSRGVANLISQNPPERFEPKEISENHGTVLPWQPGLTAYSYLAPPLKGCHGYYTVNYEIVILYLHVGSEVISFDITVS